MNAQIYFTLLKFKIKYLHMNIGTKITCRLEFQIMHLQVLK